MTDAEDFAPLTAQEIQDACEVVDNRKVVNDVEILSPIPATAGDAHEFAGQVTGLGRRPTRCGLIATPRAPTYFILDAGISEWKRKSGRFAGLEAIPASIGFRVTSPRRDRCMGLTDWRWTKTIQLSSLLKGRKPQKPQGLSSRAVSW